MPDVAALDRTFEAVVFDWDGTAVPDRRASAISVRRRLAALSEAGVTAVVVSGTGLEHIDGQLRARPPGPGRLLFALNRGSELYEVTDSGPKLRSRRAATDDENSALDRAATSALAQLSDRGLFARLVASRLNRRKIDLIPLEEWADPPKAHLEGLLVAVRARLRDRGVEDLSEVVRLSIAAAQQAGLTDPRVTSDGKHVEIGLTDKSDSMRAVLSGLAAHAIGPGLVLVVGDEFGDIGGVPGSDSLLMVDGAERVTFVSVGVEPAGLPAGVWHLPGGPSSFLSLLDQQLERRRHRRVPAVDEDPRWTIVEDGSESARVRVLESLFTVGAGGVATRGSVEESPPGSVPLVLAAGLYQGAGATQHLAPGPGWTGLALATSPGSAKRTLDLRSGLLLREEACGHNPLRTMRFASAARPGLMALRAEATAGRLRPGPSLQPLEAGVGESGAADGCEWARTRVDGGGGIAAAARERTGRSGDRQTVERLAAYVVGLRRPPSLAAARQALSEGDRLGFDRLVAAHRDVWARRWAITGVDIPDDPESELGVRFALFQLWCNTGGRGEVAVGARGLSGPGYAGHVFWDADVFVLPAVVTMDPRCARGMLEYRVRRLAAARSRARADGRDGARFPWESARDGDDVTPQGGDLGGHSVPILTGRLEEHITADVAWAAHHYGEWSGDSGFRVRRGAGLLVETARYWASRARVAEDGSVHLERVIGPDEYHEAVDDNAFTNVMAQWNLRRGADISDAVDGPGPETRRWRELADRLVTGYDPETALYEQFRGYFALEPLLVRQIAEPPIAADVLLGRDRVARSQLIKQPDVLMAHHMLPEEMAPGSLGPNVAFYAPRTAHGSSLSPAIMASVLARAGRSDEALGLFRAALRIDLDDVSGLSAGGLHLATMGGVWQAVLLGFAGIRVRGGTLHVDPRLPTQWGSLRLRLLCLGRRVVLNLSPEAIDIRSDGQLRVKLAGERSQVLNGTSVHEPGGWGSW